MSFTSTTAASVMLVAVSAAACHHERGLKNPAAGEAIVVAEPTLEGPKAGTRAVFGDIEIVGNTTLADQIIRRQLLYRPGDRFSRKDILDSQRQLASMPLLDSVKIEIIDDPRRADVRTRVTVVEGDPRRVSFAFGFGTEEKLAIEATLEHVNFLGGARTLGVDGKWSWLDRGVEGRFLQPYFFRRDLSLTLQGRAWHVDERGFRALSQGGRATVTHTPAPALSTSVSFVHEFDTSRITDESLRDLSLRNELTGIGLDSTTGTQKGVLSAVAISKGGSSGAGGFISASARPSDPGRGAAGPQMERSHNPSASFKNVICRSWLCKERCRLTTYRGRRTQTTVCRLVP